MRQAWVVVLWEVDPDESVLERSYVFPGRAPPRDTYELCARDPADPYSPLVLHAIVWADSDNEAVTMARRERARLMLSGMWHRQRLIASGDGKARSLVILDPAQGGAQ
jgi:hypothetical protein